MRYEIRVDVPDVSPAYAACLEAYQAGRIREARGEALRLKQDAKIQPAPLDFLLCSSIARSCCRNAEYHALIKLGHNRYPDDFLLSVAYSRILTSRGYRLKALAHLEALAQQTWPERLALVIAAKAVACASMEFRERARKARQQAEACMTRNDPEVWYELACASFELLDWEAAIRFGFRAVEAAPNWPRARANLVYALLTRGRLDEAEAILRQGLASGIEDGYLDFCYAMFEQARGRLTAALDHLQRYLAAWPPSTMTSTLAHLTAVLLWDLGRCAEARDLSPRMRPGNAAAFRHARGKGRHKFIPTGFMTQRHNQCVPTASAMVAWAQGVKLSIEALSEAMHSCSGTLIWRMVDAMRQRGFQVVCVHVRDEIVRYFLDRGIPLIGHLEGVTSSHVEVVCGYNEDLRLYYIRDPFHWFPLLLPQDHIADRYSMHGASVLALIAPGKNTVVPTGWISPIGTALVDLSRACTLGDLRQAEEQYTAIPDNNNAAFMRDVYSLKVMLSPARYAERMHTYAWDHNALDLVRLRAMLSVANADNIDDLLAMVEQERKKFGQFTRRYIQLIAACEYERWQEGLDIVSALLERAANLDVLWMMRGNILAETGQIEDARQSLETALEISPASPWLHDKAIWLASHTERRQERITRIKTLIATHPDAHALKQTLATLLADDPDGLRYEKAELEVIAHFPRDPQPYKNLVQWYLLSQDRVDLAQKIIARGRKLLDEHELPELEQAPAEDQAGPTAETTARATVEQLCEQANLLIEEGGYRHPDELWPIAELRNRNASGSLRRRDAIHLLGLRIKGVVKAAGSEGERLKALKHVLPPQLDAPLMYSLNRLLENLDLLSLPRTLADSLCNWADRLCSAESPNLELRFHLAQLQQAAGRWIQTLDAYDKIRQDYPEFGAIYFHMGQIHFRQGNIEKALAAFTTCLDAAPGMPDALEALAEIHGQMGQNREALAYHDKLQKRLPYSEQTFFAHACLLADLDGLDAGLALVDQVRDRFPASTRQAFRARLLVHHRRFGEAQALALDASLIHESPYQSMYTRLLCAVGQKQEQETAQLCEQALAQWPDDAFFLRIQSQILARQDPTRAQDLLRKALLEGKNDPDLAELFVHLSSKSAIQLVAAASDHKRSVLATLLADALHKPHREKQYRAFLTWCAEHHPDLTVLRERLAVYYETKGKTGKASEIAQALYEQDPDNPCWLALLSRCIQNRDPSRALAYLRKEYELTESVDCLCRQARSFLILDEHEQARSLYWQVIKANPFECVALSGLFFLGEPPVDLLDPICASLRFGAGATDDYFHVAAVNVALATGAELPIEWYAGACARLRIVTVHGGYRDEKRRLRRALTTWRVKWDLPRESDPLTDWLDRLFALHIWPGTAWVPEKK